MYAHTILFKNAYKNNLSQMDESVDEDEETEQEEESDTEEAEDVEEDDNPDTEEAEEMEEDDDKHSVSDPWTFLLNCSTASIRKASL